MTIIRNALVAVLMVFYFSYTVSAANILVLEEVASPSHHLWFKTVTTVLAAKGYNITVVSGDEDTSVDNIHYIHMDKLYEGFHTLDEGVDVDLFDMGSQSLVSQFQDGIKMSLNNCKGLLTSTGWEQLRSYPDNFKFDLIIHDYMIGNCLLNFMEKFTNVPLISMTAFIDYIVAPYLTQSSLVPALNPYPFFKMFPKTFLDRVSNVLFHLADKIINLTYASPKVASMVQNLSKINTKTSAIELSRKSILYLTNYDAAVDGPQQLPPNVIGVGGLQIKSPRALPDDLQNIFEKSQNGVVLFSLGTNVESEKLGDEIISNILEVFGRFPQYSFLWKIDLEKFPIPLPRNVFVRKWMPQNDILAQNKTKLFITHAGLLSTQEAIWHGVPMLGIPVFADQFANIHKSVDKGIAEYLYFTDLTKRNLYEKLHLMLTNSKYEENIQITSKAFKDQKETPLERVIFWIEWAIRNPKVNHFKGNGQKLNFIQIESIDVYAFLTTILLAVVWLQLWILCKIVRCICARKSSTSQKPISKDKKRK